MAEAKILVIDDEPLVCESCYRILSEGGYEVRTSLTAQEAFDLLEKENFDLVITDLKMPGMDGMEILKKIKRDFPQIIVIMITGYSTVESAVEAMKLGAFDYVPKPFTPDELSIIVKRALQNRNLLLENLYLRQELQSRYKFDQIIGKSKKMQEIYKLIEKVAPTDSTILIYGDSGTGKELIARAIHYNSHRKEKQFVPVDCAVLSENLLESELFGHVKGSFTGAITTKPGLFEIGDGGTIFLDEIANISLTIQSKLLRVLQEREFMPVGGTKIKKVDIRLIAATNKNLEEKIKEGTFREDLYYRLNIVPLFLPPLRERKEDISLLAAHFLKKYNEEMTREIKGFSPEAMDKLLKYHWPGNVRELENVIERVVVMAEGEIVRPEHILFHGQETKINNTHQVIPKTSEELKKKKKQVRQKAVEELERAFILEALDRNNWNITKSAQDVKMQRSNFQSLMKKYNIKKG